MSERNYWVICDDNCKFEGMTKEQIIAAIAEATGATPTQIDDAFITKVKEKNRNAALTFWIGTQAEYNAITTPETNCFYIISDDNTLTNIQSTVTALSTRVGALESPQKGLKLAENDDGFSVGATVHEATDIHKYKLLALEFRAETSGVIFRRNVTCLLFIGNESNTGYLASTRFENNAYDAYFSISVQNDGFTLNSCGSTSNEITIKLNAIYGVM